MRINKKSPILGAFNLAKDIVKLGNEWRDTLLYFGLAVVAVANGFMETPFLTPKETLKWGGCAVFAREWLRMVCWDLKKEMKVAGVSLYKKRPLEQCVHAATSGAFVVSSIVCMLFPSLNLDKLMNGAGFIAPSVSIILNSGLGSYFIHKAGGPKEAMATFDYIWDWPRKRDGGNAQTEKFKAGASTKLNPFPEPTPQPA